MGLKQREYTCGPFRIRENIFESVGDKIESHKHDFPHMLYVVSGAAVVCLDKDKPNTLQAGEFVLVPAGQWHSAESVAESTLIHCTFPHRDLQGRLIDKDIGNDKAYN